jgi:uncharacterized protein YjbI with pentapeptide repeats
MPWITVDEPFAKPPRVPIPDPRPTFSGPIDTDRGLVEFEAVTVEGTEVDLTGCNELEIRETTFTGSTFSSLDDDRRPDLRIHRSHFSGCDLSGQVIRNVRSSRFSACKMIGADFSGGTVADVVFERCILRYVNFRMATLSRVEFIDCTFDDVDCYQMEATDVAVPGSSLSVVNFDAVAATRFDLREAKEIIFSAVGRLDGCLVAEHQLPGLAYSLAMAAGVQVERELDEHDEGAGVAS